MVVPTSTSFAPARLMISGMRKAPPISINSPRDTIASRPLASVLSTSSTAAALLLTTVASSAPVSSRRQIAQNIVAVAALAGVEIVFERDGVAHRRDRRRDRGLGHQGTAQIGVQHRAGEIVDRPEPRRVGGLEPRQRQAGGVVSRDGKTVATQVGKFAAHRVDDGLMPEACRGYLRHRAPHHRVDGRQAAPVFCFGIRHSVSPSLRVRLRSQYIRHKRSPAEGSRS